MKVDDEEKSDERIYMEQLEQYVLQLEEYNQQLMTEQYPTQGLLNSLLNRSINTSMHQHKHDCNGH